MRERRREFAVLNLSPQSYLAPRQGEENLQYFAISVVVSPHKLPSIKFLELFNLIKNADNCFNSTRLTAVRVV
jgi:hypothetical protein